MAFGLSVKLSCDQEPGLSISHCSSISMPLMGCLLQNYIISLAVYALFIIGY